MSLGPEARHAAFLAEGRFMVQCCGACARHVFYPRTLCPHCGAERLEWVEPSGRGAVYSFSVISGKPPAADRTIVLVDLEEGVRLMGRLDGVPAADLRIGLPVQGRVQPEGGRNLLVFSPRSNA